MCGLYQTVILLCFGGTAMAGKAKGNSSTIITVIAIVAIIVLVMVFSYIQWIATSPSGSFKVIRKSEKEFGTIDFNADGTCVITAQDNTYDCTWERDGNFFVNSGSYVIKYNPQMSTEGTFTIGNEEIEYTAADAASGAAVEVFELSWAQKKDESAKKDSEVNPKLFVIS